MKSPTGVVYILVKNSTAEEIDSAIIHARRLMGLLLDNEQNMRRSNCHAKSLGDCQITANQSQAILPQVYCWAFCSDEILEYPPSIEIYNILKGDSRTILGIPLLRTKNNRLKHDLVLGTPAAIILSELFSEAGVIGQVSEEKESGTLLETEGITLLVESIFGTNETLLLTNAERKAFYLKSKEQLAKSSEGQKVFNMLRPYGVSSRTNICTRFIGRFFS